MADYVSLIFRVEFRLTRVGKYKCLTMYHPYYISFFLGLIMLQLPTTVASCPPSNPSAGAKTIQFCSGAEVTSDAIYIDSSDVANRETNCTCTFIAKNDTTLLLATTTNQNTDCRTNIKYGQQNSHLTNFCGKINIVQPITLGFNYILLLTNGIKGLKTYCLKLIPGIQSIDINLKCFQDTHVTTATTTSTEPPVKTKDTTVFDSTTGVSTTFTTNTGTTPKSKMTVQPSTTTFTSTNTHKNKEMYYVLYKKEGLPVHILAPATTGGVLVVIVITISAIVCSRRKRKRNQQYDESGPKADAHSYMNQAVVHDEDDDDVDDMRDNELYRSMDSDPLDDNNTGGYAEINLTNPRDKNTLIDVSPGYAEVEPSECPNISNTDSTNTQKDQTMHSIPINRPLKQIQGGVVYSMPVKKPKTLKPENDDAPVYAMPDKKKNQKDLETGPMYAMVNKKTKNETINIKTNAASKPHINKKPAILTPKPFVFQSGGEIRGGNVSKNGLYHSDIELNNSRTTTSSLEFNVSDKSGYAEVL